MKERGREISVHPGERPRQYVDNPYYVSDQETEGVKPLGL